MDIGDQRGRRQAAERQEWGGAGSRRPSRLRSAVTAAGCGGPCWASLLLLGCGGSGEEPASELGGRRIVTERWDTLWSYVSSLEDTLLTGIRNVRADPGRVYVLSRHVPHVVVFDARTGRPLWSGGTKGEGPTEFADPLDLKVLGDSAIAVLDVRLAKIVQFGSDGDFLTSTPLRIGGRPQSFCPLDPEGWIIKTWDVAHPLRAVSLEGDELTRSPLPWSDSVAMHSLMQAAEIFPREGTGECALAMAFGRGWMRVDSSGIVGEPRPYVEDFDFPGVILNYRVPGAPPDQRAADHTYAAVDLAVRGDTLAVGFLGQSEHRSQWIDFYDLESMTYLHSYRYPGIVRKFAWVGGVFYMKALVDGYSGVFAVRPVF